MTMFAPMRADLGTGVSHRSTVCCRNMPGGPRVSMHRGSVRHTGPGTQTTGPTGSLREIQSQTSVPSTRNSPQCTCQHSSTYTFLKATLRDWWPQCCSPEGKWKDGWGWEEGFCIPPRSLLKVCVLAHPVH